MLTAIQLCIANSDGRLEVFVIGSDNKLYHKWQNSPGSSSSWTFYHSLEGNDSKLTAILQ